MAVQIPRQHCLYFGPIGGRSRRRLWPSIRVRASGLEQRRRSSQWAAGVHEVHRVGAPALGIPVEPRGVGGLGVLDPSLLHHDTLQVRLYWPGW